MDLLFEYFSETMESSLVSKEVFILVFRSLDLFQVVGMAWLTDNSTSVLFSGLALSLFFLQSLADWLASTKLHIANFRCANS